MGRRALEGRVRANWRVDAQTPAELNVIAVTLGFPHGEGGAVGKMLDAVASGDYLIVPRSSLEKKSRLKKKAVNG